MPAVCLKICRRHGFIIREDTKIGIVNHNAIAFDINRFSRIQYF